MEELTTGVSWLGVIAGAVVAFFAGLVVVFETVRREMGRRSGGGIRCSI